jgi:hypothetical protein
MGRGRHSNTDLRSALAERSRGLQLQFQELANLRAIDIEPTLLWHRGETVETALERLATIKPDPDADCAPLDEIHPAFESIDERWAATTPLRRAANNASAYLET